MLLAPDAEFPAIVAGYVCTESIQRFRVRHLERAPRSNEFEQVHMCDSLAVKDEHAGFDSANAKFIEFDVETRRQRHLQHPDDQSTPTALAKPRS